MSGKTIDVEAGDTFTVSSNGRPWQYRNGQCRGMGDVSFTMLSRAAGEQTIARCQFEDIAEMAGYSIVERIEIPRPVVITHGVLAASRKDVFTYVGTEAGCHDMANDRTRVVPVRFGGASNG